MPHALCLAHGRVRGRRDELCARPCTRYEVQRLAVGTATGNRDWGYPRIRGALANLGHEVVCGTVRTVEAARCGYEDDRYPYPCGAPATVTDIEIGRTFCASHFREADSVMAHYYQTEVRETFCEVCGELTICDVFGAEYPEQETGYVDELVICAECQRERGCADESPLSRTAPATTAGRRSRKSPC